MLSKKVLSQSEKVDRLICFNLHIERQAQLDAVISENLTAKAMNGVDGGFIERQRGLPESYQITPHIRRRIDARLNGFIS